ncbi:hypothetical protein, partial [Salmonella enterica]|uniref:hypothetical protein n=1 Tax=Salmonella enterica TaxID=28901 RepID=UPI00301CA5B1
FVSQVTLGLPHTKEPLWARACLEAGLARSHIWNSFHPVKVLLREQDPAPDTTSLPPLYPK